MCNLCAALKIRYVIIQSFFWEAIGSPHHNRPLEVKQRPLEAPSLPPLPRREHDVKVVSHILIDAGGRVAAASVVNVHTVVVIVVGVDVVVDVEDERDDGGDEADVAHGAGAARQKRVGSFAALTAFL